MAEIRELVLTFLESLSRHALPKNRKRETLDACMIMNDLINKHGPSPTLNNYAMCLSLNKHKISVRNIFPPNALSASLHVHVTCE